MALMSLRTRKDSAPRVEDGGQPPKPDARHRLGERLVAQGLITEQQLQQALDVQRRSKTFLGQILVDLGFIPAQKIGAILAADFGVPYVDLLQSPADPEAVRLVPEHM